MTLLGGGGGITCSMTTERGDSLSGIDSLESMPGVLYILKIRARYFYPYRFVNEFLRMLQTSSSPHKWKGSVVLPQSLATTWVNMILGFSSKRIISCMIITLLSVPHSWPLIFVINFSLPSYLPCTLIKKKIKFSSFIRKFVYEEGLPNVWGNAQIFPHIWGAVSHIWLCNCSILNFLIIEENLILFFISVPILD